MAYTISNDIRVGSSSRPTYRWTNPKIVLNSARGIFTVDILGNELPVDTFSAIVRTNVDVPLVYAPVGKNGYKTSDGKVYLLKKPTAYGQNFLKDIDPGTVVYWYVGGSVFAKGYLSNVQRVARYNYKITCISGVGLLTNKTHYGGIYNGVQAGTIIADIIGNTFSYTINNDVSSVLVYGHLPYDTARKNLHRLLFAIGAVMLHDVNGNYVFSFLSDSIGVVPTSRITISGKTQYTIPADSVEITEHSFFSRAGDEVVSLFDNNGGNYVVDQTIIFDEPMHDLAAYGSLSISESSVNHAVVSGVGELTGQKYTHNSLIIRKGTGSQNVKHVQSNELVSFANSHYVADRVYSYYTSTKDIDAKILLESEAPGQLLSLKDAFGDPTNAYLSKMDIMITSVKVATCKLISGFVPGKNGNNFNHRAVITANTTFVVPSDVTRVRIVLVGGAQGGQGGYDGENGLDRWTDPGLEVFTEVLGDNSEWRGYSYMENVQPPGEGGNAGAAGLSAYFLVSDQDVVANDQIAIVVGVGGAGGAANGVMGDNGTPSTAQCSRFGMLSSADGIQNDNGYYDPVGKRSYAVAGVDGKAGGRGGRSQNYGWSNSLEKARNGAGVKTSQGVYNGGVGGNGYYEEVLVAPVRNIYAGGGGGGGAAAGSVGGDGGAASYQYEFDDQHVGHYVARGGDGGNGADAVAPSQPTVYGMGGSGGHGGGGGGNAGGSSILTYDGWRETWLTSYGSKGLGGIGSSGSQGGNGIVFIYY